MGLDDDGWSFFSQFEDADTYTYTHVRRHTHTQTKAGRRPLIWLCSNGVESKDGEEKKKEEGRVKIKEVNLGG